MNLEPDSIKNLELKIKADAILQQVIEGDIDIFEYDVGNYIDESKYDFEDWIENPEAYISEIERAFSEKEKIELLSSYIANLSPHRALQLINQPNSISKDELLEWKRNWLNVNGSNDCDMLVLIPIELDSGIKAAVAIICYANIPGGETSLVQAFETLKEGEEFFVRYTI